MNSNELWMLKLAALMHDPPGKVFDVSGHGRRARDLLKELLGESLLADLEALRTTAYGSAKRRPELTTRADQVASGADRLTFSRRGSVPVSFAADPVVTHPLGGPMLEIPLPALRALVGDPRADDGASHTSDDGTDRQSEGIGDGASDTGDEGADEQSEEITDLAALVRAIHSRLSDDYSLRRAHLRAWRRLPFELELLGSAHGGWAIPWLPADSRQPDHSIWEHVRVASALAFLFARKQRGQREPEPQTPYLVQLSVGPVQAFIAQVQKLRDLWMSSYVLSELALAAMRPIVEAYGPEAIVYPDLRGNARFDQELQQLASDTLPPQVRNPFTQAATIPSKFVALLPKGGGGELRPIEEVLADCVAAAKERWTQIAEPVRAWLQRERGLRLGSAWSEQIDHTFRYRWLAIPWIHDPALGVLSAPGHGLPAQISTRVPGANPDDSARLGARKRRLGQGMTAGQWGAWEARREALVRASTFGRVSYAAMERGFDYPFVHRELSRRARERSAMGDEARLPEQSGVRCTTCGLRCAVGPDAPATHDIDEARKHARDTWRRVFTTSEGERLCAVCATRRFGSRGDRGDSSLVRAYGGVPGEESDIPFPSTALVAALPFLEEIALQWKDDVAAAVRCLTRALHACGPDARSALQTAVPTAYARLHESARPELQELLSWEAQVLFPETLDSELRRLEIDGTKAVEAAHALRACVKKKLSSRFALLRIDGDSLGALFAGAPGAAGVRWDEVVHPQAVATVRDSARHQTAGTANLLGEERFLGPSTHAFITRALTSFAHTVVPWVVEHEFSGRVVYVGGDDLLVVAPEGDAFGIVSRLDQLFSASWVIDTATDPKARASWDPLASASRAAARQRFAIPAPSLPRFTLPCETLESPTHGEGPGRAEGTVFAQLGPHRTFSAGIVFAHFKTHLGNVLRRAGDLLNDAKGKGTDTSSLRGAWGGRHGMAFTVATRGGFKSRGTIPLRSDEDRRGGLVTVQRVVGAFEDGVIPSRLPYKLREHRLRAEALCLSDAVDPVTALGKLVTECADGQIGPRVVKDVVWLWRVAIERACEAPLPLSSEARATLYGRERANKDRLLMRGIDRGIDLLLLCRALGTGGAGGDE